MALVLAMTLAAPQLPALAKELKDRHLELGKQSTALSKEGKYAEAADLLEKFAAELKTKLAGVSQADQDKADVGASRVKFLNEGIAILRQRAAWAAKADKDLQSAQKLLLELLEQLRWDVDTAEVRDARVQALLDAARKLDPKTKALFLARKVKVVVDAPALNEKQRAAYAKGVAEDLRALGLVASVSVGEEEFKVTATVEGPVSAHLIGDDVNECTLEASAAWKAGGLAHIDLEVHGFGDETEDDDCVNARVKQSAALAAKRVLRAWAGAKEPLK